MPQIENERGRERETRPYPASTSMLLTSTLRKDPEPISQFLPPRLTPPLLVWCRRSSNPRSACAKWPRFSLGRNASRWVGLGPDSRSRAGLRRFSSFSSFSFFVAGGGPHVHLRNYLSPQLVAWVLSSVDRLTTRDGDWIKEISVLQDLRPIHKPEPGSAAWAHS
jgi:hypothetical protein